MSRFGFCGGSYTLANINADCQTCMNWYPSSNESGAGNSAITLDPTPGLKLFSAGNGQQVRGEWTINGRSFAVIDTGFIEIAANGTRTVLDTVANDGNLVSMCSSAQQLAICSAGQLYVYYLRTVGSVIAGTFIQVLPITFNGPVYQVMYLDGFFIVIIASTEQYYASQALDATVWPPLATQIISTFADNVVSSIVDHRQLWLMGAKQTEADGDAGTFPNPLATIPGGFVEQGSAAQFGIVQMDNSVFWMGARNDQGWGIAWRMNGYVPERVSNQAVEFAWQKYPTLADIRSFAYQDQGHTFWVINFPSANKTWVYDAFTQLWHERGYWYAAAGIFQAALPQCHTFNFGKHLVGDRQSGNIYQMAIPSAANGGGWDFVTDNGAAIRRVRRAPHISTEQQWIYYDELQVYLETGLGPTPPLLDGAGNPRDPMITLRYSGDGGHTWTGGRDVGCGQAGNYANRVMFRRLGRARDRVYEISVSDPVPYRIVDAYLKASPGFSPQERLLKQAGKVA